MLPWTILEEQVPVTRNTATGKIGSGVILLLWQLRRHRNPNHIKFSSLSNTTFVTIFPYLCLWRRSLCSNLVDIDSEKLDRTSLVASVTQRRYSQFPWSPLITPGTTTPLLCTKCEDKNGLQLMSLATTRARLNRSALIHNNSRAALGALSILSLHGQFARLKMENRAFLRRCKMFDFHHLPMNFISINR